MASYPANQGVEDDDVVYKTMPKIGRPSLFSKMKFWGSSGSSSKSLKLTMPHEQSVSTTPAIPVKPMQQTASGSMETDSVSPIPVDIPKAPQQAPQPITSAHQAPKPADEVFHYQAETKQSAEPEHKIVEHLEAPIPWHPSEMPKPPIIDGSMAPMRADSMTAEPVVEVKKPTPVMPKSSPVIKPPVLENIPAQVVPKEIPDLPTPERVHVAPKVERPHPASPIPVEMPPIMPTPEVAHSAIPPESPSVIPTAIPAAPARFSPPPAEPPTAVAQDFPEIHRNPTKPWVKPLLIALALVVVLGSGYAIYAKTKKDKKDTDNSPVVTKKEESKIPGDWRAKYFGNSECTKEDTCGDLADPDHDGLTNLDEYNAKTDPNNSDSDSDGIADGDEVHVFGYDPTQMHTSGKVQYSDTVDAKDQWNSRQGRKFNADELTQIANAIKQYGFHDPTIATLGPDLITVYTSFGQQSPDSSAVNQGQNTDTPTSTIVPQQGALDRDTQRADTINKIGAVLLNYKQVNSTFPNTNNYDEMIKAVKPLLATKAINTSDPVNKNPYVYSYQSIGGGVDFKLSYYSETQNQAVTITAAQAQKALSQSQADQRDTQRKSDVEQIAYALQLYSNDNADPKRPQSSLYPSKESWKDALLPKYLTSIPTDPQNHKDYAYSPSAAKDNFTISTILENPPYGKKGYQCVPDDCDFY